MATFRQAALARHLGLVRLTDSIREPIREAKTGGRRARITQLRREDGPEGRMMRGEVRLHSGAGHELANYAGGDRQGGWNPGTG